MIQLRYSQSQGSFFELKLVLKSPNHLHHHLHGMRSIDWNFLLCPE